MDVHWTSIELPFVDIRKSDGRPIKVRRTFDGRPFEVRFTLRWTSIECPCRTYNGYLMDFSWTYIRRLIKIYKFN